SITPLHGKGTDTIGAEVSTSVSDTATLQFKDQWSVTIQSETRAMVLGTPDVQLANGEAIVTVPGGSPAAKLRAESLVCTISPQSRAAIEVQDGSVVVLVESGWAEVSVGSEKLRLAHGMGCSAGPNSNTPWPPYR